MAALFCLSPRYRLDDELPWLEGIDPSRHYWLAVNGNKNLTVALPGLVAASVGELKQIMSQFRALQPGEKMNFTRAAASCTIHCVGMNCYALAAEVNGSPVWHLFDQETLDSLLMTAHPDWQCAPSDVELGRKLLMRSLAATLAAS
ncbi:hypothetical protein ACQFX9_15295 [Aliinostoc sp. HNIBRCY26]|uniref:hypothetical protein n=1 Tax=Aliinostoc sp. HNIBRCY26 TaxID=3418997 RepID=UPI003CFCE0C5